MRPPLFQNKRSLSLKKIRLKQSTTNWRSPRNRLLLLIVKPPQLNMKQLAPLKLSSLRAIPRRRRQLPSLSLKKLPKTSKFWLMSQLRSS